MSKHERLPSLITEEEATLLHTELLRRAASGYEQIGSWREAAECWAEQGASERAGALYAQAGDLGHAGRSWLQAGRYHEALQAYRGWEQQLWEADSVNRLQVLLGQAACHVLGSRTSSSPTSPELSEATGWQAYQQARELLGSMTGRSVRDASCWEALGDYGGWLGRYDLVQEGYERALTALVELKRDVTQQVRICRAYLVQARVHADRLLCQQLEEWLAAWPGEEKMLAIAPFPVERTLTGHTGAVRGVAISPDGRRLVSTGGDNMIRVWDLSTGKEEYTLTGHTGMVWGVAISADGHWLVSGSMDKTIKVWELSTGKEEHTLIGHAGYVWAVAISPDGQRVVSGSWDKTIKVWDLATGKEERTLTCHTDIIWEIAISPNGQTLVSGNSDKTIKVWNLSTGQEERTLIGHENSVYCVAISPNGQTLVSGGGDKTIKVWNLSTGKLARTLIGHEGFVQCVA
ncbi:MAG TPA: WD40 repeat domain-containing protein, partial [Ktedonobacteraceae bacterium]